MYSRFAHHTDFLFGKTEVVDVHFSVIGNQDWFQSNEVHEGSKLGNLAFAWNCPAKRKMCVQ